jgi:hypothetical protein
MAPSGLTPLAPPPGDPFGGLTPLSDDSLSGLAPLASDPLAGLPSVPMPAANPLGISPNYKPNPYESPSGGGGYSPRRESGGAPMVLAILSLISGVIGLLSCGCCLFLFLPPLSLLLGTIALCLKPDQNAKVMAIVGIVLSILTLGFIFASSLIWGLTLSMDPDFQRILRQP